MAEIKASGDDIIACANNILELSKQYQSEIDSLFETLSKLNKTAWSGNSANAYVLRLRAEKSIYTTFGQYLNYYGNVVKNVGNNVNTIISKWEDK
jgi:uncharacterized protein YukE